MITYRKATADDIRPALDLALKVFMEFEAAEYEPEATLRFKADVVYNAAGEFLDAWFYPYLDEMFEKWSVMP